MKQYSHNLFAYIKVSLLAYLTPTHSDSFLIFLSLKFTYNQYKLKTLRLASQVTYIRYCSYSSSLKQQ